MRADIGQVGGDDRDLGGAARAQIAGNGLGTLHAARHQQHFAAMACGNPSHLLRNL